MYIRTKKKVIKAVDDVSRSTQIFVKNNLNALTVFYRCFKDALRVLPYVYRVKKIKIEIKNKF